MDSTKEIVTLLGKFKPSALVKHSDYTPEMKAQGIVPKAMVKTSDGITAEVICTFGDGRVLASGRYYNYKNLTVLELAALPTDEPESAEGEERAIATKTGVILPEILADNDSLNLAPTHAQWLAAQSKLKEVQLALKSVQVEIEQLTAENLKLHATNGNLHNEIAHLVAEIASLKQQESL